MATNCAKRGICAYQHYISKRRALDTLLVPVHNLEGTTSFRSFSVETNTRLSQKAKAKETHHVVEVKDKPYSELTTGQKVARAGKDATYTGIVVAGLGVTGLMFYAIGRELFSGQSPSGIYGRALKLCRKHDELTCAIGEPIKGYGEMTRRGRRRHVNHAEYSKDGVKYMRMHFYVEGPDGKGTAHLEMKQNERGKYDFRYLYVELDKSFRQFIIVDNR